MDLKSPFHDQQYLGRIRVRSNVFLREVRQVKMRYSEVDTNVLNVDSVRP